MPRLIVLGGTDSNEIIELDRGRTRIGRGVDRDIIIYEKIVSRHHASIIYKDDSFYIKDESSRYGTLLNDETISEACLQNNDIIKIGLTRFMFEEDVKAKKFEDTPEIMMQMAIPVNEDSKTADDSKVTTRTDIDKRLDVLYQISRSLHNGLDMCDLLSETLDILYKLFSYQRGFFIVVDPDTNIVRPEIAKIGDNPPKEMNIMPFSRTIVDTVINTRNAVLIQNAKTDERFGSTESIVDNAIQSALCTPILSKKSVVGVVYLDTQGESRLFSKEDLELLSAVSSQVAVAMENAILYKQVKEESKRMSTLSRFFSPRVVKHFINSSSDANLTGNRFRTTIFFTDVRGFTELSQKHEPEQIVELLNRHFDAILEQIFHYGGTLDKFIGDSVMAFFGAPIAQADAAERALKTAIASLKAIRDLNRWLVREGLPKIEIGIGIATGDAIVGTIGSKKRMEYTAIGGTVNIAARLVGKAGPAEILIDRETYMEAGNSSITALAEEIELKGIEERVSVYRIRS